MGIINMVGESKKIHHHLHQQLFHQDSWFDHMNNDNGKGTPSLSSSSTITSSIGEESTLSDESSIVSDDAASTASSSFSPNSLLDLSEIMTQLPIKRGLSKFYQGKSESFTSLSRVTSIDDLAKKANSNRRNLRASKSIGTGLHSYKSHTLPKPVIAKKTTRVGCSSFSCKRH